MDELNCGKQLLTTNGAAPEGSEPESVEAKTDKHESREPDFEPVGTADDLSPSEAEAPSGERERKCIKFNMEISNKDPEYKNGKEKVYDFLREKLHLSVRVMDIVIVILIALALVFVVIGYLNGDGGYVA